MEVKLVSTTTIGLGDPPGKKASHVPFTVFDRFASDMHIASLYAFAPPTPTNAALKQGLAETLLHFPTLTGRCGEDDSGRPCFVVGGGDGGVLVVETAVAPHELRHHLPLEPSPELLLLHPPTVDAADLLQIQLNRFPCGGLVIGLTANHRVADGQAMGSFMIVWGRAVRGLGAGPYLPTYDQSWLRPREPPRCEFDHWGVEFAPPLPPPAVATDHNNHMITTTPRPPDQSYEAPKKVCNVRFHYSRDFIDNELKPILAPERHTTFETLLGHVWRKVTMARRLRPEETTQVRVGVNGRPRMRPQVPPEYFGNLVLYARPQTTVGDLIGGGLAGAARTIRDAVRKIDGRYLQSFVDFGDVHGGEELVSVYDVEGMTLCPNLEVNSWLGLHFHEVDFGGGGGGGGPCAFVPSWIPTEGIIVFIPTLAAAAGEKAGVDVTVTLFEEDGRLLKQISHSLD